jgi:uncharacterized protein YcbX
VFAEIDRVGDHPRMTEGPGRVAWIAIAPVKSMALAFLDEAQLGHAGIAGDRAFALVDSAGRLVNGKRAGVLATVRVAIDPAAGTLTLHLPTGETASGRPILGDPIEAIFFGHPRPARIVDGPWSAALSTWSGHDLRFVAMPVGDGLDRGPSATLVSTAALGALAAVRGGTEPLDRRRFRMTFGIDGIEAYAEDRWIGRRVRIGAAVVQVAGNVGRCAVTTHDPDTGRPTFDTLHALQQGRGHLPASEPLPFGVWSDIVQPGRVALGDEVTVEP